MASAPTRPRRGCSSARGRPSGARRNFPSCCRSHRPDRLRPWSPPGPMPRRVCLSALLAPLALAALPALASAGWFPAQPVDGPAPDIEKLGGVDLARDGTGGVVYLKRVDGAAHVFLSRFTGGRFRAPERVDNGRGAAASGAAVAAGNKGRLAIAGTAGPRVYGSVV